MATPSGEPARSTPAGARALPAAARLRVSVLRSLCVGSGLCTEIAPRVFTFDARGKAKAGPVDEPDRSRARDAAEACPVRAILLREHRNGAAGSRPGH